MSFAEFGEQNVLYMNLMTRVDGDPDQQLFYEMGCTGFPTLAVLDADGMLLAKHRGQRDVEAFGATLGTAREFRDLLAKADGGDAAARLTVLEQRIEWGSISHADATKAIAGLSGLDGERKANLEQRLIPIEFNEATREKDHAKRYAKLEAMRAADRIPADQRGNTSRFWMSLVAAAEQSGDNNRMRVAIEHAAKALAGVESAQKMLEAMQKRLEELEAKK